ncbi:MAG: class I SAM-dependent methyltransferase [Deferribacteres bacterium]|nr:class I SAM-dependent methyltransferase [candidate division KSB1 bacterium]MCB9512400.1 class I SAM-dependent methyltransferase [Deferribacteres bacterium]
MQKKSIQHPQIEKQQEFWNRWNTDVRENGGLDLVTIARAEKTLSLLDSLKLENPEILDVGCGTGWLCEELTAYGSVTGIDLADSVIERAQRRHPNVQFFAGDAMEIDLPKEHFDIIICLETLSHMVDQSAFIDHLVSLLKPSGYLILTTQNKFVFERRHDVMEQGAGQVRNWLTVKDVRNLIQRQCLLHVLTTIEPAGHRGILRLVNSAKLNRLLGFVLSAMLLKGLKESVGFGQTIVVMAQKNHSKLLKKRR